MNQLFFWSSILLLTLSCKKECDEFLVDNCISLTLLDAVTLENISGNFDEENFYIHQLNVAGIPLVFLIDFEKTPLTAKIAKFAAEACDGGSITVPFGIFKNNSKVEGKILVTYQLLKNECGCEYSIDNIGLDGIDGQVINEEFSREITLHL